MLFCILANCNDNLSHQLLWQLRSLRQNALALLLRSLGLTLDLLTQLTSGKSYKLDLLSQLAWGKSLSWIFTLVFVQKLMGFSGTKYVCVWCALDQTLLALSCLVGKETLHK